MSGEGLAPSAVDRVKLAKVLSLIDSPVAGEAAAAARAAAQMVSRSGLSWDQVLNPAPRAPAPVFDVDFGAPASLIKIAIEHRQLLLSWEVGFIESIRRQRAPLGPLQSALLTRIARKAFDAAKAARPTPAPQARPRKWRKSRRKRRAA